MQPGRPTARGKPPRACRLRVHRPMDEDGLPHNRGDARMVQVSVHGSPGLQICPCRSNHVLIGHRRRVGSAGLGDRRGRAQVGDLLSSQLERLGTA